MEKTGKKLIASNKKAFHEYFLLEDYEAGIVLHGTEVKSLRQGKCSIKEAFVKVESGEIFICQMHIPPYEQGNIFNKDPLRQRKLLMHKYEIGKLAGAVAEKGVTIVPVEVYFKDGRVKLKVSLAKGKKLYDKRHDLKEKDAKRDMDRALKNYR